MAGHESWRIIVKDQAERVRGIELKLLRIRAGLRQYRVAQELGIPPSILCEWENERRPIPPQQGPRILAAIDRLAMGGLQGAVIGMCPAMSGSICLQRDQGRKDVCDA